LYDPGHSHGIAGNPYGPSSGGYNAVQQPNNGSISANAVSTNSVSTGMSVYTSTTGIVVGNPQSLPFIVGAVGSVTSSPAINGTIGNPTSNPAIAGTVGITGPVDSMGYEVVNFIIKL